MRRSQAITHAVALTLGAMMTSTTAHAEPAATQPAARANLAIVAAASTSFVSGHEALTAIQDGRAPRRSNDFVHGAYGNWPRKGTQWVQYDWPVEVSVDRSEVYWYDDNRGVRLPRAARLQYWDGTAWQAVKAEVGRERDQFNVATFDAVRTTKLRLEIDGDGEHSTGIIEWRAYDAGGSPDFPPILRAGPDRIVVDGGRTYLSGTARDTGKPGVSTAVAWTKSSGPGDVTFDDAKSLDTAATFSAPGEYELALTAKAGELSSSDQVRVRVEPAKPVVGLSPVDTHAYKIGGEFWRPRVKALIVNWIPHCIAENDKPDLKEGGINNLIEAGKKLRGEPAKPHVGYPFSNAWVLNTVEAMCVAQMVDAEGDAEILAAQKAMRDKLEVWIPILLAAQEPDGYFQTRYTLGSGREQQQGRTPQRWDARLRGEHEGYVAGYFLEAAIAHYQSTGGKDRRLYDAAKKLADCWDANVGPAPKKAWYDGHQAMEIALFRFARLVDEAEGKGSGDRYAALGKFLLDCRGNDREAAAEYDQSHQPVTRQYAAVGHAVRAVYSYAAMADAARLSDDRDYQSAVRSLWDNLVNRKLYVTGGVGSGETSEGFGADYSLPTNAYCESCAGAGMVFLQQRMNLLFGDARYADLMEETLYNAVLSDVDLAGQNFTYTNSLDTDEARYKWHVCPCCVGNIPRTLLSLPTWAYAAGDDGLRVNLFLDSTMTVKDVAGADVKVTQATRYPWDGKVTITLDPASEKAFALRVRVPDRSVSEIYTSTPEADGITSVKVNGEAVSPTVEQGYAVITRTWKRGDTIEVELPLTVQRVRADERVAATRGRVALRRGPLLYNFEAVDQKLDAALAPDAPLTAEWSPELLGGVVAIKGTFADGSPLTAIPNYARNNRGGRSVVWVREQEESQR